MALQISIQYHNHPVVYEVTAQEEDVYHLRRSDVCTLAEYIPKKFFIRRKGKIWISDVEDYRELVDCLIAELQSIQVPHHLRA